MNCYVNYVLCSYLGKYISCQCHPGTDPREHTCDGTKLGGPTHSNEGATTPRAEPRDISIRVSKGVGEIWAYDG